MKVKYLFILLVVNFLSGCNTVNGAGKDLNDLGYFIQDGVSDMQDHLKA